ncbi:hypothetical protein AVEN_161259-1 [Araneus ventricosus]|uniref:Uncharacterized protein n=1 Tax=Araneus ventricosus TaxID=182803 RepID=A0A4Y2KA16_ARAVE|nr:hypothetical protein AVEN_161259-1 [Araneus ventricosus]
MLESIFSFPCLDLGTQMTWILYATNVISDNRKTACAFDVQVDCTPSPTLAAAEQHSCRAYQVQQWLNEQKDPLKWGWKTIGGHLRPITTTHPAAPKDLLSLIVCMQRGMRTKLRVSKE